MTHFNIYFIYLQKKKKKKKKMKFLVLIILTIACGIHGFGSGKLPKSVCKGIENTVWKFQKFPATQILREMNFRDFRGRKLPC